MKQTRIHCEWASPPLERFRTGVSLHSHTFHSRESLDFIYRLTRRNGVIRMLLKHGERRYRQRCGYNLDLRRAWWTPPCSPYDAWLLETNHIRQLGLDALVSLTDHDNIEAPLSLRSLGCCQNVPVSVEWTVPYDPTFFHLGVHNLSAENARRLFDEMQALTRSPRHSDLAAILESLSADPAVLIVFNHPAWDEEAIGSEQHLELVSRFLRLHGNFVHALELNGLRPWRENRQVLQMASACNKAVVAGGDRHTHEPNTLLDLTNATTFGEYVEQVRRGWTNVLVTNAYRERFSLRIFRIVQQALRQQAHHHQPAQMHGLGRAWTRWSNRTFYQGDDGVVRSLSEIFPAGPPRLIKLVLGSLELLDHPRAERTFRRIFRQREEFAL